ncbi:hypothetical protein [Legionella septentrionalis]|uniref:Uncharacterized protein n=1 Tax=Legionella septentrionalis TaxID=2498109 RepID=A0A3S0VA61_9GAMM|nr:hypothetical protein [Legionella septentrionalis]RUQ85123.1 hypothetical protein EKM59_07345 [Legionella septentrionalis]RUQ94326.1 hypothetical protein ELY11_11260 [Legionella septentrionalis]
MRHQEKTQLDIEHLLFELSCCVNNLSRYRLNLNYDDIQQAELSLNKLELIISFVKQAKKSAEQHRVLTRYMLKTIE